VPKLLHSTDQRFEQEFAKFLADRAETVGDVRDVVTQIVADIRNNGDTALIEYTKRFDQVELQPGIALDKACIAAHAARCPADVVEALELAAARIRSFHDTQKPTDTAYTDDAGVKLGVRWRPVTDVGLYVPGGMAAYPSSVLMNAIPAKVAGAKRLVMVVPTPHGEINAAVMAAAQIAGVDEIYPIGGAQAVAALAYGTQSIKPVHVIVGPGNAYVAEAKRQVFGTVGIDMVAGPSEILVVADNKNNPHWIAADLLSQAEHDKVAQSILITDSNEFAENVMQAVEEILATLPREAIARTSWQEQGAVIIVPSLADAPALVDILAPEHLELAVDEPEAMAERIQHAGAIFLGRYTPEAIGDYVAGPSHVLPTSRTARFSSALTVTDFMKRSSLIQCSQASLRHIAPAAEILANAEGLHAHALSVSVRMEEETV
jgi:histidinol dehydrogenase